MLGQSTNPQLQQVEQAVQGKVPPELMGAFQRIVTAGLKVMYSPQTRQMLASQLKQQGDPSEIVGQGIAKLMAILYQQSKGTMPMKAAIPAAQVLTCEAIDFAAKAGIMQITNDTIAQTTQEMVSALLQVFGFSQSKVQQFIQAGMEHSAKNGAAMPTSGAQAPAGNAPPAGGIVGSAMGGQ